MNNEFQETFEAAERMAAERFGENDYTIASWCWCDGDYRIEVRSAVRGDTDAGNTVREEIVLKPFRTTFQIVEVAEQEKTMTLKREDISGEGRR